jgi:hypothetical protein
VANPDLLADSEELVASLRRVVEGQTAEIVRDANGAPVALLTPVIAPATPAAREAFLEAFRAWRGGDPAEQLRDWEQLEEVLAEERSESETP